jgi:hypothetical protein
LIEIFNEAVSANNKAVGLEALKEASEYFLKNCWIVTPFLDIFLA